MDLLAFLKKEAEAIKVKEIPLERSLQLKGFADQGKTIFDVETSKSGVVYGYGIYLDEGEKKSLMDEAIRLERNRFQLDKDLKEIHDNFYPLYWGKSELVLGRLNAHIKGHKGNNNLHLGDYKFFQGKTITYSVILVEDNKELEQHLIDCYPPMLKTIKE